MIRLGGNPQGGNPPGGNPLGNNPQGGGPQGGNQQGMFFDIRPSDDMHAVHTGEMKIKSRHVSGIGVLTQNIFDQIPGDVNNLNPREQRAVAAAVVNYVQDPEVAMIKGSRGPDANFEYTNTGRAARRGSLLIMYGSSTKYTSVSHTTPKIYNLVLLALDKKYNEIARPSSPIIDSIG